MEYAYSLVYEVHKMKCKTDTRTKAYDYACSSVTRGYYT